MNTQEPITDQELRELYHSALWDDTFIEEGAFPDPPSFEEFKEKVFYGKYLDERYFVQEILLAKGFISPELPLNFLDSAFIMDCLCECRETYKDDEEAVGSTFFVIPHPDPYTYVCRKYCKEEVEHEK